MTKKENTARGSPVDSIEGYLQFRSDITGKDFEAVLWSALGFEPDQIKAALENGRQSGQDLMKDSRSNAKPSAEDKARASDSFPDSALQSLFKGLQSSVSFRETLLEAAKLGSEPAFAGLLLLSFLSTMALQEVSKQNPPLAEKWASRFLMWPWFYSPVHGYQRKLERKIQKVVGRNTAVGSKFSRDMEGQLNLESMMGMLWIMLVSSWYDEETFRRNPKLAVLRQLRWGSPAGNVVMKKALTYFLEELHEQATLTDDKLKKSAQSERRRPIEHAAYHAAQMLLQKQAKPNPPKP